MKIKESFTSKKFKSGAYSSALVVIVIVIAIFANLFANQLNLKVDLSTEGMYTLTEETKNLLRSISDEITLYYIVQDGSENSIIQEIVDQYSSINKNVSVIKKDPVLYPKFASQYIEEEPSQNSVIVVNETKDISKYVNYTDMLVQEINYSTYQPEITAIDVEGQITSAVQYVTTEDKPVLYQVEGHGELPLNDTLIKGISKLNIEIQSLSTLSSESIPQDCDMILINGPTNDYSKEEITLLKNYMEDGGRVLVFSGYGTKEELPNLAGLLSSYGVEFEDGLIIETMGYYVGGYPNYLVPDMSNHDITSSIYSSNKPIVAPVSSGLLYNENLRDSLQFETLLTTSNESYSKVGEQIETVLQEDGDISGPFDLGAAVTEEYNNITTKLVVYASSFLLDEGMVGSGQFANETLLINSINWLIEREDSLSIPTKSITQQYLSVPITQIGAYGILFIGIIPIVILGTGFIIWFRRRRA